MKKSKWYLVQGQTQFGNYALVKEEETDLIVAEFPAVDHHAANERTINLNSIISEHNEVVNLLKS
jgi:hypothetical protein